MEAEERACASALIAIDKVFAAFKIASQSDDFTELPRFPFTITINHQGAEKALEAFRKAIDALYQPTDTVIESGRDPIIRLFERVVDRYDKNHTALSEFNTPRNDALMRMVYGYCQRFAPINFMQAFAQGLYCIVVAKEKLTRSFEYLFTSGHFILPLDPDPVFRLGFEHFCDGFECGGTGDKRPGQLHPRLFVNQKQQQLYHPVMPVREEGSCTIM